MSNETLLVLDGNSLLFRAFYAIPELTTSDGIHTNAVYGFTNMLFKAIEEIKPNYIVTAFDKKAPTFRHLEYQDYKAGRKKTPDELNMQFPIMKEVLEKMAINVFEIEGFEADDIIGTLSVFAESKGMDVYVMTGDKDALQLATEKVKVVINKKGITEKEIYTASRMMEEFGITPKEFIDVKGLMGDKSDNIPGVPGIGEKTAFKLIKEYKSIENLLENLEMVSGKKLKESLMEYSQQAIFSKKLATIVTNVPIELDMDDIKSKSEMDIKGLKEMFYKLQFKSLIPRLSVIDPSFAEDDKEEAVDAEYEVIDTFEALNKVIDIVYKLDDKEVYVLFENTPNEFKEYSKETLKTLFLNINEINYVVNIDKIYADDNNQCKDILEKLFADESVKVICHGAKPLYISLYNMGIRAKTFEFDTEIGAYLIESARNNYEMVGLIEERMGTTIKGEGDTLLINAVNCLSKLYKSIKDQIESLNMHELLYKVELPLTRAIAFMECEGFNVDKQGLDKLGTRFKTEIDELENSIYSLAEEKFNINSPKQLGKILFEKLDLPVIKKTKTGYSTNAEVLEALKDKHPIIEKIFAYRQLTKLYSTYIEGLRAVIGNDGKIHSNFTQTVTTTGRLSSTEPNLQNIPVRTENGRAIRKVFTPVNENCIILSADYSQIELRVLAHISQDIHLINAFKQSEDIHTITASEVFKVPVNEVTSQMRSNAKAVNFGIVYGIGDFSLAQDLGISKKEAKEYIDNYMERYSGVGIYMDKVIEDAEKTSFVTTILNRRRFIPEINSSNKMIKALGKRLAMNAPIQGSAADIIKIAMVRVSERLYNEDFKSRLILQVHDELILNVYKDEIEKVTTLVKNEMENACNLDVPLMVDVNTGNTWYEAK